MNNPVLKLQSLDDKKIRSKQETTTISGSSGSIVNSSFSIRCK